MKARTLIGMLIAGGELRDMMEAQENAMKGAALVIDIERQQREKDNLHAARHSRDMLAQFIIALDNPEEHDELRLILHEALQDMADQVARVEEHVG